MLSALVLMGLIPTAMAFGLGEGRSEEDEDEASAEPERLTPPPEPISGAETSDLLVDPLDTLAADETAAARGPIGDDALPTEEASVAVACFGETDEDALIDLPVDDFRDDDILPPYPDEDVLLGPADPDIPSDPPLIPDPDPGIVLGPSNPSLPSLPDGIDDPDPVLPPIDPDLPSEIPVMEWVGPPEIETEGADAANDVIDRVAAWLSALPSSIPDEGAADDADAVHDENEKVHESEIGSTDEVDSEPDPQWIRRTPAEISDFVPGEDIISLEVDPAQFAPDAGLTFEVTENGADGVIQFGGEALAVVRGAPNLGSGDVRLEVLPR